MSDTAPPGDPKRNEFWTRESARIIRFSRHSPRLARRLTAAIFNVAVVIGTVFICIWLLRELTDDSLVINEFEVPDQVAQIGFSGKVTSIGIKDHVDYIIRQASLTWSHNDQQAYTDHAGVQDIQFEVAGIGFSPRQLIQTIKSTLGIESNVVTGEFFVDDTQVSCVVHLRYREQNYSQRLSRKRNGPIDQDVLNGLVKDAARYIVSITDPLIVGIYYSDLFGSLGRDPSEPHGDSLAALMLQKSIVAQPGQQANAYAWLGGAIYNGVAAEFPADTIDAMEAIRKSLALDPENANAYICWARIKITNNENDKGEELVEKAMVLDKTNDLAYWLHGIMQLEKRGSSDLEALKDFEKATELAPHKYWYLFGKANALAFLGRYSEAINALESPFAPPGYADHLQIIYKVLAQLTDSARTNATTKPLINAHSAPVCQTGLYYIARNLSLRKEQSAAAASLCDVLRNHCQLSVGDIYTMAIVMANANRAAESISLLREASAINPDYNHFRAQLMDDVVFDSLTFHSALASQ